MLYCKILYCLVSASTVATSGLRDAVLSQPDLSTFKDLVDQYDVWKPFADMENITILAPNNAAYDFLASIGLNLSQMGADFTVPVLKYHFLQSMHDAASFKNGDHATLVHTALTGLNMTPSAPVKISRIADDLLVEGGLQLSAGVDETDIRFDGGVIHTLNSSLVAPHNISATAFMGGLFKFLEITDYAHMVGTLESLHDATLFIPSDEAWLEYQSSPDSATETPADLAKVLAHHAIQGHILYQQSLGGEQATFSSLAGHDLKIKVDDTGRILVDGVPVVREDLVWYGGVAHVIDKVLYPDQGLSGNEHGGGLVIFGASKTTILINIPQAPLMLAAFALLIIILTGVSLVNAVRRYYLWKRNHQRSSCIGTEDAHMDAEKQMLLPQTI